MHRMYFIFTAFAALFATLVARAGPHIQVDPAHYQLKSDVRLSTGKTLPAGTLWYVVPDIARLKRELATNQYRGDIPQANKIAFGYDLISDTYNTIGEGRQDGHPPLAKGRILNCGNCHARGGTVPYAWPFIRTLTHYGLREHGDWGLFSAHLGYYRDARTRARDCALECGGIVNIGDESREMDALMAWMKAVRDGIYPGEGILVPEFKTRADVDKIPGAVVPPLTNVLNMKANPRAGAPLYKKLCSSCHGLDGAGRWTDSDGFLIPPLAGPHAFADLGGPFMVPIGAAFLFRNMPLNAPGTLSEQQALDIMAYVASLPRETLWWNPFFYQHDPCSRPAYLPLSIGAIPKGFPFDKQQVQFGPWKKIADWLASDACRAQNKPTQPMLQRNFDPLTPQHLPGEI